MHETNLSGLRLTHCVYKNGGSEILYNVNYAEFGKQYVCLSSPMFKMMCNLVVKNVIQVF